MPKPRRVSIDEDLQRDDGSPNPAVMLTAALPLRPNLSLETDEERAAAEKNKAETEEKRRERVYLAVSNHINELTAEYVKDAVDRYVQRLSVTEDPETVVRGPSERLHLNSQIGKEILAGITEIIFTAAMRFSYFRFPDGFGSFRVQQLTQNPRPKRLPTGKIVDMPNRRIKFKYEDGAAVRDALGLSKKTNYVRRYDRESRLSRRTQELLLEGRD